MHSQEALSMLAKEQFKIFIALIKPDFIFGRFNEYLISKLQAVADGKINKLCLSVPPRHGKSYLISELLPAWLFARNISEQIMAISYGASLAADFGVKVRAIINSAEFQALFPQCKIAGDGTSGMGWRMQDSKMKGQYNALGTGGPATGKGVSTMIVDDPTKSRADAESPAYQKALIDFFGSTCFSRLEPSAKIIVVHTRWIDKKDLIGWILDDEDRAKDWEHISFPAIAMETDALGRKPGEALFPERYDVPALLDIKKNMPAKDWSALYLCDGKASQSEASPWQSKYWRLSQQSMHACDILLISIDAASELHSKADFTGITVWKRNGKATQCIEAMELKLDFAGLLELIKQLNEEYSLSIRKPLFLIEKASNGIALGQYLQANCKHMAFEFASAHTNKKDLFKQACNTLELNDVSFSNAAILAPEQLSKWPLLEHDDVAISAMQALVKLASLPAQQYQAPAVLSRSNASKYKWD